MPNPNIMAKTNTPTKQDFMSGILHAIFPPGNPHLQELKRSYASPLNEGITTAKTQEHESPEFCGSPTGASSKKRLRSLFSSRLLPLQVQEPVLVLETRVL